MYDVRELRINLIWLVAGKWIGSDMRIRFTNINIAVESMAHSYYLLFFLSCRFNVVFLFSFFVCSVAVVVSRSTTLMNCRYNVGFFSHFCYYLIRYFRWICNEFCADIYFSWCIFGPLYLFCVSFLVFFVERCMEQKTTSQTFYDQRPRLVIVIVNTHVYKWLVKFLSTWKLCSIINRIVFA